MSLGKPGYLLIWKCGWCLCPEGEGESFAIIRILVIAYQGVLGLKYICKIWISISNSKGPIGHVGRSQFPRWTLRDWVSLLKAMAHLSRWSGRTRRFQEGAAFSAFSPAPLNFLSSLKVIFLVTSSLSIFQ